MDPHELSWITEHVAITNFFSAHDKELLARNKVKAILCLDRYVLGEGSENRGVESIQLFHLNDGANPLPDFVEAVETLEKLIAKFNRVVVHCRASRSRSVAVVAAYITKVHNVSAGSALAVVRAKRDSSVAAELVRLVERFVDI